MNKPMDHVAAIVLVDGADRFAPTLDSVLAAVPSGRVIAHAANARDQEALARVGSPRLEISTAGTLDEIVAGLRSDASLAFPSHVVVVTNPVVVPSGLLDGAIDYLDADLRVATVSFLSNSAGYLSVPQRDTPTFHLMSSHDEESVTEQLRSTGPDGFSARFASVPAPAGSVHLLSRHALSACDGFDGTVELSANGLVADFALRAQRRGFVCAVDSQTFVLAPADTGAVCTDPLDDPSEAPTLFSRHSFVAASLDYAKREPNSPTSLVVTTAAAAIRGLRIAIDGRCLGELEMGTQVQTLALARELARRSDVQVVTIATGGPIPPYAADVFGLPRVRHHYLPNNDFGGLPEADVLHRPYQPDSQLPFDTWRAVSRRVIVTLQDLIAYEVGAYARTPEDWASYRWNMRKGAELSDGVIVISEDTKRQVAFERLAISPDRTFVVPNGTDHLAGTDVTSPPEALIRRGFGASRFLLVLGANYAHKNRDLAIRAWQEVQASHPDVNLVMVGAAVPYGSSRVAEASLGTRARDGLYILPDVTSAERNWLLRHAEAVLYPTSAEGFGLVPFEAAHFGTPTVNVGFGPLSEVNPDGGGSAETWAPMPFADAIRELLDDPSLRTQRVTATLRAGTDYTWAGTASGLMKAYRDILSRPPLQRLG